MVTNKSISMKYTTHDPINITNDKKLAAVANNGTGTVDNPYIIAGWNISDSPTHGISITGTTKYLRIENCWIERSNDYGICLDSVAPGTSTVANNTCTHNAKDGISLWYSHSTTVANNTCTNNGRSGIFVRNSESSTIAHNTCNDNWWDGTTFLFSFSSTITNNTCTNNGNGINLRHLYTSTVTNNICVNNGEGITLGYSDSSTVVNNICNSNENNGIYFSISDNNSVAWNSLIGNGNYGIELADNSDNNSIHHNNFLTNGQNESQAYDDGTNNQWFNQKVLEGNYWSDYNGTGSYPIAGAAEAKDPYPSRSLYKYTSETEPQIDLSDLYSLLTRIGLFILIVGVLGTLLFVNRRKKSG
ncbi:MAG: right-handed parallel beta-helix repeat-containing protein [Candidatus Heimdallarchaeota archaeon]|nr:MAG: right-handed parallel beta-helix repeat-containing protein [Candidatus Heimdallarchaeota archaeon]